jgi:hypothetical protein
LDVVAAHPVEEVFGALDGRSFLPGLGHGKNCNLILGWGLLEIC